MEDWLRPLIFGTKWISAIPILLGLIRWRNLHISQKLIFGLAVLALLAEMASLAMGRIYGNNLPVFHVYVALELGLLTAVYSLGYSSYVAPKNAMILTSLFVAVCILNVIFFQNLREFNSNTRTVEAIYIICLAIGFFVVALRNLDIPRLDKHPIFWVSCGVLIFFTANLLLFFYSNLLKEIGETSDQGALTFFEIWAIHGILNAILYLFYTRALLCRWRESE